MPDRSRWPRRIIMPLAILAVAAGLGWWSGRIEARQQTQVHDFVEALCDDVLEGRDAAGRLAATDPLVRTMLVRRLLEILEPDATLTIEVTKGDTTDAGRAAGTATHVAVIKLDGARAVGLRAVCGDNATVAIIGFF